MLRSLGVRSKIIVIFLLPFIALGMAASWIVRDAYQDARQAKLISDLASSAEIISQLITGIQAERALKAQAVSAPTPALKEALEKRLTEVRGKIDAAIADDTVESLDYSSLGPGAQKVIETGIQTGPRLKEVREALKGEDVTREQVLKAYTPIIEELNFAPSLLSNETDDPEMAAMFRAYTVHQNIIEAKWQESMLVGGALVSGRPSLDVRERILNAVHEQGSLEKSLKKISIDDTVNTYVQATPVLLFDNREAVVHGDLAGEYRKVVGEALVKEKGMSPEQANAILLALATANSKASEEASKLANQAGKTGGESADKKAPAKSEAAKTDPAKKEPAKPEAPKADTARAEAAKAAANAPKAAEAKKQTAMTPELAGFIRDVFSKAAMERYLAYNEGFTEYLGVLTKNLATINKEHSKRGLAIYEKERDFARWTLAAVGLVLLISAALAWWLTRSLTSRIVRLTRAATRFQRKLPSIVRSAEAGDDDIDYRPIPVESRDEVGRLADAFNTVNTATIEQTREQARLQKSISNMFVNVARRDQVLLSRQLTFLDELQRTEENPTSLEHLFKLDHLATRMRRNAESLLVLAGVETGRRPRQPMSMSDVVRIAYSEIEDFERVELATPVDPKIQGRHALSVAHLVAELLENACRYSNPGTRVTATVMLGGDGVRVTVTDAGIGMTTEEVVEANAKIEASQTADFIRTDKLGLAVIGRLAGRLDAVVTLTSKPGTGTVATVDIPARLFIASTLGSQESAAASRGVPAMAGAPAGGLNMPAQLGPSGSAAAETVRSAPPPDEANSASSYQPVFAGDQPASEASNLTTRSDGESGPNAKVGTDMNPENTPNSEAHAQNAAAAGSTGNVPPAPQQPAGSGPVLPENPLASFSGDIGGSDGGYQPSFAGDANPIDAARAAVPGAPAGQMPGVPASGAPAPGAPGAPAGQMPGAPAPGAPGAPAGQMPGVPAPGVPAPGAPAGQMPGVPAPGAPAGQMPGVPAPGAPAGQMPGVPAPGAPAPGAPAGQMPGAPVPGAPAPGAPTDAPLPQRGASAPNPGDGAAGPKPDPLGVPHPATPQAPSGITEGGSGALPNLPSGVPTQPGAMPNIPGSMPGMGGPPGPLNNPVDTPGQPGAATGQPGMTPGIPPQNGVPGTPGGLPNVPGAAAVPGGQLPPTPETQQPPVPGSQQPMAQGVTPAPAPAPAPGAPPAPMLGMPETPAPPAPAPMPGAVGADAVQPEMGQLGDYTAAPAPQAVPEPQAAPAAAGPISNILPGAAGAASVASNSQPSGARKPGFWARLKAAFSRKPKSEAAPQDQWQDDGSLPDVAHAPDMSAMPGQLDPGLPTSASGMPAGAAHPGAAIPQQSPAPVQESMPGQGMTGQAMPGQSNLSSRAPAANGPAPASPMTPQVGPPSQQVGPPPAQVSPPSQQVGPPPARPAAGTKPAARQQPAAQQELAEELPISALASDRLAYGSSAAGGVSGSALRQRSELASQALAELSMLSSYSPDAAQSKDASTLTKRQKGASLPQDVKRVSQKPAAASDKNKDRDANQVRSMLSGFQAGVKRGRGSD